MIVAVGDPCLEAGLRARDRCLQAGNVPPLDPRGGGDPPVVAHRDNLQGRRSGRHLAKDRPGKTRPRRLARCRIRAGMDLPAGSVPGDRADDDANAAPPVEHEEEGLDLAGCERIGRTIALPGGGEERASYPVSRLPPCLPHARRARYGPGLCNRQRTAARHAVELAHMIARIRRRRALKRGNAQQCGKDGHRAMLSGIHARRDVRAGAAPAASPYRAGWSAAAPLRADRDNGPSGAPSSTGPTPPRRREPGSARHGDSRRPGSHCR